MNLIGKKAYITARDSWAYGEWGIIRDFDGDYYYIAIADGNECLVFTKDEFKEKREVKK